MAIDEELKKRDLSEISTPKLFEMMIKCIKALKAEKECISVRYGDGAQEG